MSQVVPRVYDDVLRQHLDARRQMAFVSGPRQVGKTTTCRGVGSEVVYANWDDQDDRALILRGPKAVVAELGLERARAVPPILVLDELHKYRRWRTFLKGLFDRHGERLRVIVTGSARLDVYRRGGDSLMGRYLPYRMHPLSAGELLDPSPPTQELRAPGDLDVPLWDALLEHGGYPEPFVARERSFSRRWRRLRTQQLVREDVRDLTGIQEIGQLEVLTVLLEGRSGQQLSYSSLAREINVAVDTVRRWVATLTALYHGFLLRPYFRNVTKALRKEPKWYLRDWSGISDAGARTETFVACHLLKAVELWEDLGLGTYELRYLRDKEKREVDFLVLRNHAPWFLIEVKQSDTRLSSTLGHFQKQTNVRHAVQGVMDLPYEEVDCFGRSDPCVVPVRTLLSQLP
jgi:predicted AAA+ superfamily ATPase